MSPFETYKMYLAIKMHFKSDSYDYFKYNGAINASKKKFESKNDKYFFTKLSKKFVDDEELKLFLAINFFEKDYWIGRLFDDECRDRFIEMKGRHERISHLLEDDLDKLLLYLELKRGTSKILYKFNWLFKVLPNQHPILFEQYLSDDISIETFLILEDIFNFFQKWDEKISDTIIWPEIKGKCLKLRPFFDILNNKRNYVNIVHNKFCNE